MIDGFSMFFPSSRPLYFYQKDQLWDILKAGFSQHHFASAARKRILEDGQYVHKTIVVGMGMLGVKNHGCFNTQTVVHDLDDLGVPGLVNVYITNWKTTIWNR